MASGIAADVGVVRGFPECFYVGFGDPLESAGERGCAADCIADCIADRFVHLPEVPPVSVAGQEPSTLSTLAFDCAKGGRPTTRFDQVDVEPMTGIEPAYSGKVPEGEGLQPAD